MLSVIIVDDRPAVCKGLQKMINWDQIQAQVIGVAHNGQDALNMAVVKHPDVIITDVRMPIMDGLEMARHISERLPDTVIIVLSAYDDFTFAQSALRFGVTDYILKPIDRDKIEKLERRIEEISKKRVNKRKEYGALYESPLPEKASLALKTANPDDIAFHFENEAEKLVDYPLALYKDLCARLAAVFFDTLKQMNVDEPSLKVTRDEVWEELVGLKTKSDLMSYMKALYMNAAELLHERKSARSDTIVEHVRQYIADHYQNSDLSVYSIADANGLSANYTSILFRQLTGINISAYITNMRMNKAKELLKDMRRSIQEVSALTGYADSHYFAKVFKKHAGVTPSEYRNLVDKKSETP